MKYRIKILYIVLYFLIGIYGSPSYAERDSGGGKGYLLSPVDIELLEHALPIDQREDCPPSNEPIESNADPHPERKDGLSSFDGLRIVAAAFYYSGPNVNGNNSIRDNFRINEDVSAAGKIINKPMCKTNRDDYHYLMGVFERYPPPKIKSKFLANLRKLIQNQHFYNEKCILEAVTGNFERGGRSLLNMEVSMLMAASDTWANQPHPCYAR